MQTDVEKMLVERGITPTVEGLTKFLAERKVEREEAEKVRLDSPVTRRDVRNWVHTYVMWPALGVLIWYLAKYLTQ